MSETKIAYDRAADKLQGELTAVKAGGGNRQKQTAIFMKAVAAVLLSFCAQSERFAEAVIAYKGKLYDLCKKYVDAHWTTGGEDKDALAELAAAYMPGATVRASYRIVEPPEEDEISLDGGLDMLGGVGSEPDMTDLDDGFAPGELDGELDRDLDDLGEGEEHTAVILELPGERAGV